MAELITVAGRTLSGEDQYGVWITHGIEGWFDSPEVKGEVIGRANSDGDFDLPIFNESRFITVNGSLHTKSHSEQHQAMNFLTGLMSGRFQVSGHGATQWADVKRNAPVRFNMVTGEFAQWQVSLKASDPRKFGNMREINPATDVTAELVHYGNYQARPTFRVTATTSFATGYYITGPNNLTYRVVQPLNVGGVHDIDFNTGQLVHNGIVRFGYVSNARMWGVEPGQVTRFSVRPNSTGAGMVRARVFDTYI